MFIVTANTNYEVKREPTGGFHVDIVSGKNKGMSRDGDTIEGTKRGAIFILSSRTKGVIIRSTTVLRTEGQL